MNSSRYVLMLAVGLVTAAGCSSGNDQNAATSIAGSTTSAAVAQTTVLPTAVTSSSVAGTVQAAASTSTAPPTTVAETDPPPGTSPAEVIVPPTDDCIIVAGDTPSPIITITDSGIQYEGIAVGLCLRVVELQSLTIVNGSGGEASVDVGTDSFTIASGQSQATETVGTYAGIGEVFDLYVAELDISVVVQVLPIE